MKIPFFVKSVLIGIPVGVTFFDCIGYIAKVEGKKIDLKKYSN